MAKLELQKNSKSIGYGDALSHLFLWEKAILLVPIWAIAIVPVIGFLCRSFGHTANNIGFGVVLCCFVIYFLQDLLKRKILLDDEYIFWGFKAVPIKSITGIDVTYKKGKFLPAALILNSENGQRLKFNLNGLTEEGVETFLKHLQSRNSTLKTAAVLNTLVKCRTVKRKQIESRERLEIAYHSRRFIGENVETFKSTAMKWARVGPVLACVLSGYMWLGFLSTLYLCLRPHPYSEESSLLLKQFLQEFFSSILWNLYKPLADGFDTIHNYALNPVVTFVTASSLALSFGYLIRLMLKPNCLIADKQGVKLQVKFGELAITVGSVAWAQIAKVDLQKEEAKTGRMRISKTDAKKFDIDLAAIAAEDRVQLLKHMEKLVPTNQIDYELSQAMLPKSDRSYTEIWLQSLSQSPERRALEPLEPGQIVGDHRFEVLNSIGVGGQGKAYLCRSLDSDHKYADIVLKETIIPVFADGLVRRKALESFEKEASLLKSLQNPGIVTLIDYFVEDHRAYLVLEHIDGCNLRDLVLRDGPLPEEQVRSLAIQMCDILKYLHANSVVHRDFTPDNLILNSKGQLKLIDFNVAQQIQGGSSGTIVGKHAYLPPEQFRGKATSQSDLYAMGATLFFLLTGTDPEPISQSSPAKNNLASSSAAMDQLVKHATALQTNNRYKSAEEIEADLLSMDQEPGAGKTTEAQPEIENAMDAPAKVKVELVLKEEV